MDFTAEQRIAIDHSGSALLVSAAAGSGKTAVLVERAVKTLCDPAAKVPADGLLIVTFTKAAAASLRAKLAKRLRAELQKTPTAFLRRQLLLLQRAPICTIDAYCLQLVKAHFSKLDIPPDFAMADSTTLAALRQESLASALEQAYQDPDFCRFSDLYGKGRTDKAMEEILVQFSTFLSSLPHPEKTLDEFCAQWQSDTPFGQTVWGKALLAEGETALTALLQLSEASLAAAVQDGDLDGYLAALQADIATLQQLLCVLQSGDWNAACAALSKVSWQPLKPVRGYTGIQMECIKQRRDTMKRVVEKLATANFFCTEAEFEQDRQKALPLVQALVRAQRNFRQIFLQAKLQEKLLDFGDVEQYALQLLWQNGAQTPLAQKQSEALFAVMVDEYQDTNALQDALYHSLAGENAQKLFLVGDLKQSIYRFRQADPSIFQHKLASYHPVQKGKKSKVFLDKNFRSAPGVIAGINSIFAAVMSRPLGGVEYGKGERLVPGFGDLQHYQNYEGGMEICLVTPNEEPTDTPTFAKDAGFVAQRIAQLMQPDSGFRVREGAGQRAPRYEDFCILLRSRSGAACYADALEQAGIPVFVERAENLIDAPEVRPLASLLRVLDNPAQDEHLAAVMLNLYGFSPDDLVAIRAQCPHGSFYSAVVASEGQKASSFVQQLFALRRFAQNTAADRLMEEILLRTGWLAAVGAMPQGESRRENLRSFAAFVSQNATRGLAAVVRAMDAALADGGLQAGDSATGKTGFVTIMTIHRSKGLEFPVVFVAGLSHEFNKQDKRNATVFDARLGLGLKLRKQLGDVYPTAAYRAIQAVQEAESLSEEMRVLYVAATRAKDLLVLSAVVKNPARTRTKLGAQRIAGRATAPYLLARCQSHAEWVLLAALGHPSGERLQAIADLPTLLQPQQHAAATSIYLQQQPPLAEACPPQSGLPILAPNAQQQAQVQQALAWQYPHKALTKVPAKVSVTALVHSQEQTTLQRPAFLHQEGLTAAEQGTALHTFLQHADFAAAKQDLAAEATRQLNKGFLTQSLYEQMDFSKLDAFFASKLFGRIQAAQKRYREFAFITAVESSTVMQDGGDYGGAKTLVQGVADLVLVFAQGIEIVDYKTDRGKTETQFVQHYQAQLRMYAAALQKRFAKPIVRLTIYSFALGKEIPCTMG